MGHHAFVSCVTVMQRKLGFRFVFPADIHLCPNASDQSVLSKERIPFFEAERAARRLELHYVFRSHIMVTS